MVMQSIRILTLSTQIPNAIARGYFQWNKTILSAPEKIPLLAHYYHIVAAVTGWFIKTNRANNDTGETCIASINNWNYSPPLAS